VSSRGLNLEHFLADPTAVGPLREIGRLSCFRLFHTFLFPSELVSRLRSVRKMNLAALMAVPCVFDAFFPEFNGIYSCGRKDCESFKDLKEFHDFFVICLNL
jgi:hypothetical protein